MRTVSFEDKLFFTRHLATMIRAGIPLGEAMDTIIGQASGGLKKTLVKVRGEIDNGVSLGEALGKHEGVFDRFFVSLVTAGEASGSLEKNLSFLALQLGKNYALKKKVQGAMIYPVLVLVATLGMAAGISWFVLPKLLDLFASFEVELPLSTRVLMGVAYFVRDYGGWLVIGLLLFAVLAVVLFRLRFFRKMWHGLVLRLPIFGKIALYGELGRFGRNLGTLLEGGLPVTRALEITKETLSNIKIMDDLEYLTERVAEGDSMTKVMKKSQFAYFGGLNLRMIEVGERSGNLEEMLYYLADFYDGEIDNISKNLTTLLEPVLLVFIGAMVGFVAIAIIGPIYSMVGSVGG